MISICSWNVLHLIHEMNHNLHLSHVIKKYPNEALRLNAIIMNIRLLLGKNDVICLQEVSGDLYELIKTEFSGSCNIIIYEHNRKPSIKDTKLKSPYIRDAEYLVTLVSKKLSIIGKNTIQYDENGKAALAVTLDSIVIINTHLPISISGTNAIKKLTEVYEKPDKQIVIIGDFNKSFSDLHSDFKTTEWNMSQLFFPRFAKSTHRRCVSKNKFINKVIDRAILYGSEYTELKTDTIDSGDVSDHFPIVIELDQKNKKDDSSLMSYFSYDKLKSYVGF